MTRTNSESEVRYVICTDCPKRWRYGCKYCAKDFAKYHREAFEGHHVTIDYEETMREIVMQRHRRRRKNFWER